MLSYPYDSFDPMVLLIREAAQDPKVISIRITLYRLAKESRLAEALIAAAEAGKLRLHFHPDAGCAGRKIHMDVGSMAVGTEYGGLIHVCI